MSEIILNDETVAKAIQDHDAEMEELSKPTTPEDAEKYLEGLDAYDTTEFLPKGTIAGEIRRAKKQGVVMSYGFVNSGHGDVFVPPSLMNEFNDGEMVACLTTEGPRGLAAEKLAGLKEFISWHKDEILDKVRKELDAKHADQIKWYGATDPSNGWDEMKTACKNMGLFLIEVKKCTKSANYGGRGTDTYRFAENVTHAQAEQVLTALRTRHAELDNGCPYDHGHDNIRLIDNGFENDWSGPFTD